MLKVLRRTAAAAASLFTTSPTVEEIHDDFDTVTQKAVEEANKIVREGNLSEKKKRVDTLKSLGFTSMPEVEKFREERERVEKAELLIQLTQKYEMKYPQYKFILVEDVVRICKKYGLVCAPVGKYKGEIPEKNLQEIANFKAKPEDTYYCDNGGTHDRNYFDFNFSYRFINEEKYMERRRSSFRPSFPLTREMYQATPKFICASPKDFNFSKEDKAHGQVFMTKFVEDPIVLHYVKDGFLIVSKWGPEAKDPSLVNQKLN